MNRFVSNKVCWQLRLKLYSLMWLPWFLTFIAKYQNVWIILSHKLDMVKVWRNIMNSTAILLSLVNYPKEKNTKVFNNMHAGIVWSFLSLLSVKYYLESRHGYYHQMSFQFVGWTRETRLFCGSLAAMKLTPQSAKVKPFTACCRYALCILESALVTE